MRLMPDFDTLAQLKGQCDIPFPPSTKCFVSSFFFFCFFLLISMLCAAQWSVIFFIALFYQREFKGQGDKTYAQRLKSP